MMRILTIVSLLILTSCGFTPMYAGENAAGDNAINAELSTIDIAIIPNREGQYLRNALIDRLYKNGMPTNPKYRLNISKITEVVSDFDITIDSEATRRQLKLNIKMTVVDLTTGKPLLARALYAITSHNVLESEFSTLVTEQSAREAALDDLARQVERQLALHFS